MKLKHILLECPYSTWDNKEVQKYFVAAIGLKLSGYLKEYNYGVLPFDTTDFVAVHHLICREDAFNLTPLMSLKTITLGRCQMHDLAFPILSGLRTIPTVAENHLKIMQNVVKRFEKTPHSLAYSGGLTILPEMRQDRALVAELWERVIAAWLTYDIEMGITESVGFSAVRFKMTRSFARLGYQDISLENKVLPPVSMPTMMNGYEATVIHRKEISEEGLRLVEKHKAWYKAGLQIRATDLAGLKVAA